MNVKQPLLRSVCSNHSLLKLQNVRQCANNQELNIAPCMCVPLLTGLFIYLFILI